MIKIRIKNADHEIDIRFPISESELFAKLGEIHAIEGKEAPQSAFVTEVYWPEEFSMLKDRFANLDELNYLAKRMESFDYHEYDQFLIGITKLENPTEKDHHQSDLQPRPFHAVQGCQQLWKDRQRVCDEYGGRRSCP